MSDWKPDVMIYHANCADGFGAAWAAWMRWGNAVEYVPASYGQSPPDVLDKHVLIGDFSYKREQLEAIATGAASIIILDHHKTAEDVVERVAREALFGIEPARTDVVTPCNGSTPYSYVTFAGARIEFHQTDFSKYHAGQVVYDAATNKASEQATRINDLLFEVAKRAARAAMQESRDD